jgi:two-component system, OmpR family, sensor histidine kinase KdpD
MLKSRQSVERTRVTREDCLLAMTFVGLFHRSASFHQLRFWVQSACGALAVLLLTHLGLFFHINLSTSAVLYLLAVVLVSLSCGFWQAAIVSVVSLLCQLYYFVAPPYSWRVSDPSNYLEMVVFACTALIVSRLSSEAEEQARAADSRRADMVMLYQLSCKTLLLDLNKTPGPRLVELIVEVFAVDAVAIFDADLGTIDTWGYWPVDARELAQSTCMFEANQDDPGLRLSRRALHLGSIPIGALLLRGDVAPLTSDAIASLVSITFDRYRSLANETKAEAAHQSEQLRTAVLDKLAHAFKTPLTAIRTASVGLVELGGISPLHADLAALIDEQSVLLNDLATRLLQTARLETEEVSLHKEDVAIVDMIGDVVNGDVGQLGEHPIEVSISDKMLATRGNREMLANIVRQFVDNASKYSYPGTKIRIWAEECASEIVIGVHNEGDPIRVEDRERIFERFYRCPETQNRVPGTGIGLSVAKRAAEVHHGHVWVISDKEVGTTFYLSVRGAKGGTVEHN